MGNPLPPTPLAAAPASLTLDAFLREIPKVELHCHLLGAVRRATFEDLVQCAGAPIESAEIESFYTRGEKPVGVLRVLRALDTMLLKTPDDLQRIAFEYLEDAAAHNVGYSEFFWNPTGTARDSGIPYAEALAAIVRAIRDAERQHGIVGRLVPAIDREAEPAAALEMVGWVVAHRVDEVVGIGIDYREVDRPPELFAAAYAAARRAGLKTTAHAGEFGMPWTNVQAAVDVLHVDRVDHGYTVVDNPAFAARCADAGLVFTVIPTNSYYLRSLAPERWALDHPIRRMPGLGLRIHPNTDDPTLHHVTPTQAWTMMARDFGFDLDQLRAFMLNGLDAAWIDEGTRRRWRDESTRRFDSPRERIVEPPNAAEH
jgi:adenosine deaminase